MKGYKKQLGYDDFEPNNFSENDGISIPKLEYQLREKDFEVLGLKANLKTIKLQVGLF